MTATLPDGMYPFIDQRMPLSDMVMGEAPADLERLLREQAAQNHILIPRGVPMELKCESAQFPTAVFLVYWPHDDARLHLLMPKKFAKGRA